MVVTVCGSSVADFSLNLVWTFASEGSVQASGFVMLFN